MRTLSVCRFDHAKDVNPKVISCDWGTLIKVLTTHQTRESKDSKAVGFYELKPGTTRATANVETIGCVALDYDEFAPQEDIPCRIQLYYFDDDSGYKEIRETISDYEHVFYTTYSHSPDCPKGRLVMPLSRPATRDEWPLVWAGAYRLTNRLADKQTSDASRLFYLPRCPEAKLKDARAFHNEGKWIDTDYLIELGKAQTATTPARPRPHLPPSHPLMNDFDEPRIREALATLDWDSREVWLKAGMALHSSMQGERAFSLWTEYSQRSAKFDANDQRQTWEGFKIGNDKAITLGTLFHMAGAGQPETQKTQSPRPEKSELGLAERFVLRHSGEVKYILDEQTFIVWNGNVWERDSVEQSVLQRMIETVKAIPANEVPALMGTNDAEAEKIAQWAIREAQRRATMVQALRLAAVNPALAVRSDALDSNPELFQCANGIVNLRTGGFSESSPATMHTLSSSVNFDQPAACPRWLQFLDEVTGGNADLIEYLRRCVGYSLSGKTDAQVWFFMYGLGANGKSVFLNVLRELAGTYGTTANADAFMTQQRNASGASPEMAALAFRRLVCVTEIPQGQRLDEARMKSLTGGEQITARHLYKGQITYEPRFKLWFAGNHKPTIRGNDHGMWRRIHLVPFTVQIPPEKKDPALIAKLRAELPGILNWAIGGYSEYTRIGLSPPKIVLDEVQAYRGEEDVLGDWIAECCELRTDARAPRDDLFMSYLRYCASHATRAVGNKRFYDSLRTRGMGEARSSGKRLIVGIGLHPITTNLGRAP